jgi:hypothetical protein
MKLSAVKGQQLHGIHTGIHPAEIVLNSAAFWQHTNV